MVKPLLLVALVANSLLFVTPTGAPHSSSSAAASSSSSSNEGSVQSASASASSTTINQQQSSSRAAAFSSSTSSSCTGLSLDPSCGPPQPYCKVNEIWSNCPIAVCSPKTCDEVGFPVACPDLRPDGQCPVEPGCICKENYVRNKAGICIPMTHCPSCGGDSNAVSGCRDCNKLCSNYNKKPGACAQGCEYNSCACRPGFVYDEITGKCVFPSDCTRLICKKKNEVYDSCPMLCPFRTCGINDAAISCVPPLRPGDPNCRPPVCRCRDGYYRNDVGECVLWEYCPVCRGKNEIYDPCPYKCPPQECGVNIALILCITQPKLGDPECEPGCRCIDGHVRNYKGICIPKDQCPKCSSPKEVFDPCIDQCALKRCDVDDRLIRCPAPPKIGDKDCEAGCRCADGYYRTRFGDCVTREECPPICPEYEIFSNCIQGECKPKTCSEVGAPIPCPRIDPRYCETGCICIDGYVRNENGVCIPIDQCPPTCGTDEIFSDCIEENCRPQKCSQLGFPIDCPKYKYCTKGCLCKEDYVRNSNGVCIPAKQCPSCGGDCNAESGGGDNCGRLCSNYYIKGTVCTLIYKINGCECRKGFVYDSNTKKCVYPKDCTPICKKDEVYSDCVNKPCPVQKCSLVNVTVLCVELDPKDCIKGCICKEPLMREDDGSCVPIADCKPPECKKNEVFSDCINGGCTAKNCSQLGHPVPCVKLDYRSCIKGCLCKEGYLREDNGECVLEKDCKRKCTGPHEFYACGGACDNVCATLVKQNQTNCPIRNIVCNKMCYCEKDYARAKNGTCIPIKDCKTDINCNGCNEVYEDCTNPICRPKKCSQLGFPLNCTDPPKCKKGCVCQDGYVRNSKGICIPMKHCPSCRGDKNAESGSGVNCLKKCYDLQHPNHPRPCPKIYKFNDCDCKKGYYYDENTGKCVKPCKCTPNCDKDEIPDTCINGGCKIKNCSQIGDPINDINPKKCIAGCSCKYGYLKSDEGKCVPVKECPNAKCCKHEKFVICPDAISGPQYCDQLGYPIKCPKIEEGCCPGPPGCVCEHGYVRNDEGKCIPKRKCPSCKGDPNAWSGCDLKGEKTCDYLEGKRKKCPKKCKKNSCECKDGFYYDKNLDKCVTAECCTPSCGKNEKYDNCINGGCEPRNCSQIDDPKVCIDPLECIGGCICEEGYLRVDDTGICVPKEKCPKICNKPNQVYVECPSCPPQTCESINKTHCPLKKTNEEDCVGECRCKKGYYLNLIGECISKKDCLKCTGDHKYFSCGSACDNSCDDLEGKANCQIKNKKCVERCYCEDGYVWNDDGNCVCPEECPAVNTTIALAKFDYGNTKLSINFIKELLDSKPGESFMVSAFSLLMALAQPTIFTIGAARKELLQLLNFANNEEIKTVGPIKIKSLQGLQDVILEAANKYYSNENESPVTEKFKEIADIFSSEAENIDFSDNELAAEIINKWISDQTRGLIKDFAKPEMFSSLTRLAIFNAIYYLGNWTHQFDENKTKPRPFYLNEKDKVLLPTMTQINTFKYGESDELDAKMVLLPYKGEECELAICLPNNINGLDDLVEKLDPDVLAQFKESLSYEKCNVSMPRMDIAFDFSDLKSILMKLGITAAFDQDSNNFKGIVQDDVPLYITNVEQKTVFKVNERGTEAAAVTDVVISTRSLPRPSTVYTFNANHPFLMFLNCVDTTLFCGAFLK